MLCKNTGSAMARFEIHGAPGEVTRYGVKPGEETDIPDGYCRTFKSQGGLRDMPPLITKLHPAMVPTGRYAPGLEPLPAGADANDAKAMREHLARLTNLVLEQQTQIRQLAAAQAAAPGALEAVTPAEVATQPPPTSAVSSPEPTVGTVVPPPPSSSPAPVNLGTEDEQVQELLRMKKADLQMFAIEAGVDVDESMTKDDLAEAVVAKRRSGLLTSD